MTNKMVPCIALYCSIIQTKIDKQLIFNNKVRYLATIVATFSRAALGVVFNMYYFRLLIIHFCRLIMLKC